MIKHPWHEVDHDFKADSGRVTGLIEIPSGSKAKYEVDKESGLIRLDRVVFAAFIYPINYGFIPRTLGDDGDPLDILVLSQVPIVPLCLVRCTVIGMMEMVDQGLSDEKIIAVAKGDASVSHYAEVNDLPENFKSELKHFFNHYKNLEQKEVRAEGFKPRKDALRIVRESIERYDKQYK